MLTLLKRLLSRTCLAVLLLAATAAVALWVRSYGVTDVVLWVHGSEVDAGPDGRPGWEVRQWQVLSARGGVLVSKQVLATSDRRVGPALANRRPPMRIVRPDSTAGYPTSASCRPLSWLGVVSGRFTGSQVRPPWAAGFYSHAVFPHAIVALAFSAWPLRVGMKRLLGRRRRRPGSCHRCGYDLRATPDLCPECGMSASGRQERQGANR